MSYQRKSKAHDEGGLDDWLMTYADMITLLLCFFAVFLAASVPKEEVFVKAREDVLDKFATETPSGERGPNANATLDGAYDAAPSILDRMSTDISITEPVINGTEIEHKSKKDKPDGDRIKTIEMPSAAFFTSGSATLSGEGKLLLNEIIETNLKNDELADYIITIEGHTDDVPINTLQFPSNWELSTARAASVVRYLIEQGIPPQKLRAAGYADSVPKVANRDYAGKPIAMNQAQNRRVIIKLEKIIKDN